MRQLRTANPWVSHPAYWMLPAAVKAFLDPRGGWGGGRLQTRICKAPVRSSPARRWRRSGRVSPNKQTILQTSSVLTHNNVMLETPKTPSSTARQPTVKSSLWAAWEGRRAGVEAVLSGLPARPSRGSRAPAACPLSWGKSAFFRRGGPPPPTSPHSLCPLALPTPCAGSPPAAPSPSPLRGA